MEKDDPQDLGQERSGKSVGNNRKDDAHFLLRLADKLKKCLRAIVQKIKGEDAPHHSLQKQTGEQIRPRRVQADQQRVAKRHCRLLSKNSTPALRRACQSPGRFTLAGLEMFKSDNTRLVSLNPASGMPWILSQASTNRAWAAGCI